jgi:small subunit ribosomal protein S20
LASHKSAKKSVRQDEKVRMRNRMWKSRIKTARKKLEKALEEKQNDNLDSLYREYVSIVDSAVSKGVIHQNTASRKKSRMYQKLPAR